MKTDPEVGIPVDTEEQFYITDRARLLRWMPWLHLLRAFRIALGFRKLLLGAAAALLLVAGQRAMDLLPFAPEAGASAQVDWPWDEPRPRLVYGFEQPRGVLQDAAARTSVLLRPFQSIINPVRALLQFGNSWSDVAWAWTHLLWALVIWALFGTAVSRMAALDFSGTGGAGLRDSVRFSLRHLRSAMGAPLIPVGFVGVLWLICCLGGLGARIPYVGEVLAGLLWFVPLLLGLAAAVIIVCISASWPLMMCTIGVERSDAFDGLSRGYDYLVSRPWYACWLAGLSLATGTVVLLLVSLVVQLGSHFGTWAVGSGMGDPAAVEITSAGPDTLRSHMAGADQAASQTSSAGRFLTMVWLRALSLLEWGFVYSYFWTSMTLIYLLLRKSVDGTALESVSVIEKQLPDGLPLSGVAAAEHREAESGESDSSSQTSQEEVEN